MNIESNAALSVAHTLCCPRGTIQSRVNTIYVNASEERDSKKIIKLFVIAEEARVLQRTQREVLEERLYTKYSAPVDMSPIKVQALLGCSHERNAARDFNGDRAQTPCYYL